MATANSADPRHRRGRAAATAAALVAAGALVLSGCAAANDGISSQVQAGQGYISGDGAYLEIPAADRGEPVAFAGVASSGDEIDSAELLGTITVVNFWYAGCPPCRVEAPLLAEVSGELDDVNFVGINVYDTAPVADAFDSEFGIEYPSILDASSGSAQLAFSGHVSPNAVPTTLVLDTEGRVAARISGLIRDASILTELIDSVRSEAPQAAR